MMPAVPADLAISTAVILLGVGSSWWHLRGGVKANEVALKNHARTQADAAKAEQKAQQDREERLIERVKSIEHALGLVNGGQPAFVSEPLCQARHDALEAAMTGQSRRLDEAIGEIRQVRLAIEYSRNVRRDS